jgi:hypothetical protein
MYGLVNQGVQDLVVELGGDQLWAAVKQRAGVEFEAFVGMDVYPDAITERLVLAVAEALDKTPAEVLQAFGRHWILYTGRKGGLAPMIVGLLEGLGEVFGLTAHLKQTLSKDDGADHDEFLIDTEPAREFADVP